MNRRRSDFRPLVTIDGHPIADPSEYNCTTSTVVDSARNVQGIMVGAVIRSGIVKAELKYKFLAAEDWAYLLSLLDESAGGKFINPVTLLNQTTNEWETHNLYCSDRTAGIYLRNDDGSIVGYKDCRVSLIEV